MSHPAILDKQSWSFSSTVGGFGGGATRSTSPVFMPIYGCTDTFNPMSPHTTPSSRKAFETPMPSAIRMWY